VLSFLAKIIIKSAKMMSKPLNPKTGINSQRTNKGGGKSTRAKLSFHLIVNTVAKI
jgi:hypothetical protein